MDAVETAGGLVDSFACVIAPSATLLVVQAELFRHLSSTAEFGMHRETQALSASKMSVKLASCIELALRVFDAILSSVILLVFTVKLPASISMNVSSTLADMVLPLLLKPDPAKISPALLN
jgi:hypothetical protein